VEAKQNTAKKSMNKTEIVTALCEATGLTKQQVCELFDELVSLIKKSLDEKGPGVFTIPDLLKIKVVRKPATEEHKGINPFTKQEMIVKAKPATNLIKLMPLRGLKTMVQTDSPGSINISAENRQIELKENTNMVSEGGPAG
jgi:nucleoid DNA-binding protein